MAEVCHSRAGGNPLPQAWVNTPLESILLSIVGGGTPSKSNPGFYEGDIPWMSVKDMNKHILTDTQDHISQEAVDNSSTNVIPAGTPIIATRMSLGKIVVAGFDSAINQDLKALFPASDVSTGYLIHWYRSKGRDIENLGTGTTVKGIRLEVLKALSFPLAPLAEQKVIAEKLDTLLAQVDTTKARLERIPDIIKRFRQSVLAAAVSGKLTETISTQLVNQEVVKFEDILRDKKHLSYGVLKPGDFDPNGVPMLRVMDIGEWGSYNDTEIFNIDPSLANEYKRTTLETGDIVLSVMATIGRPAVVPRELHGANVNRALAVIKLRGDVLPKYIELQLLSPHFQSAFVEKQIGSAQKRINLSDLREFNIWIPEREKQAQIVSRVEELFVFADSIEQKAAAALERVNNLTQSILAKAFRGELTANWRAANPELISGDNSAEALLAKIQAERELLKKKPKRPNSKKKVGNQVSKKIIKVVDALVGAGKPLSGQQLLGAAGYPNDSDTEALERFFLDIRESLSRKLMVQLERRDGEDWFSLPKIKSEK